MAAFALKIPPIKSLKLRGKILLLVGISAFFLLAAAGWGFWQFKQSIKTFEEASLSQNNAVNVVATESEFKKQVQEWKDTLLRGKKPEALDKHWTSFQQRESGVRNRAEQLKSNLSEPESVKLMEDFLFAHKNMGEAYRRGFKEF